MRALWFVICAAFFRSALYFVDVDVETTLSWFCLGWLMFEDLRRK